MDDCMNELEQLTKQMVQRIDEASFEEISQFVSERGTLISTIDQMSFTDEQRRWYAQRVRDILSCDPIIIRRATQLKDEASLEINKMSAAKSVKTAYDGPAYASDSVFFDSRK